MHESRQLSVLSEMNENTAATGVFDTSLTTIERSEMDHATSLVNGKSTEKKIQAKQSIGEGEIPSSRKCRNINGRSESPVQKKEAVGKRVVNKNKGGMLDHGKKPWWLKLPYVHVSFVKTVDHVFFNDQLGIDHCSWSIMFSIVFSSFFSYFKMF